MTIAAFGPDEIFGEMGCIDGSPRSASAVALEPTTCVVYSADEFATFLESSPAEAIKYVRTLAQRLRHSNEAAAAGGRRQKETSILFALVMDLWVIALIIAFAIFTSSLTIISEALRSVLMFGLSAYLFFLLRTIHRKGFRHYEFGAAKIEHFASALLGIGLLFSSFWVAQTILDTVFGARQAATPLGLALAAIINALNTLFNVINWLVVRAASGSNQSEAFKAQLHGRLVMMVSSLFLQVTLTLAALAQDPLLALLLDALGAAFVSLLMLRNGVGLIGRALPILLDARAPDPVRTEIAEQAKRQLTEADIVALQTRGLGDEWLAELTVTADPAMSPSELCAHAATIEAGVRRAGFPVTLTIGASINGGAKT